MKKSLLFAFLVVSMSVYAQNSPIHSSPQDPKQNAVNQHRGGQSALTLKLINMFQDEKLAKELLHPSRELFDLVQRYDSIYQWQWDTVFYNWSLYYKFIDLQYNAANLPTSLTGQSYESGDWVNSIQLVYTYDGSNRLTASTFKIWSGTAWVSSFQTVNTYTANNDLATEITQIWTGVSWMNTSGILYTYDNNHNLLTETDQSWTGAAWANGSRSVYTYNGNDRLTCISQSYDDINLVWINYDQYLYTYDANHNQLTSTYQIWNGISWDNSNLTTNTYGGNHTLLTTTFQVWDGTTWQNIYQTTNTYNGNSLLLTSLTKNWNGSNYDNASSTSNQYNGTQLTKSLTEIWNGTTWKYSDLELYTYGADGFIQTQSSRIYDGDQNLVTSGDSTYYYYKSVAGTHDLNIDNTNLSVNPNPNSGKFTLTSNSGIGKIEIYNFLGERVYSDFKANGNNTSEINLANQSAGLYVIIMTEGTKVSSQKILIQ